MMTIPLVGGAVNAHQIFFAQLGENYIEFRLNYITRFSQWSLDLLNEGTLVIAGAMLVPGAEITSHFVFDVGRLLFVGDDPTIDNLGKSNKLVFDNDSVL